jgi:integrase
MKTTETTKRGKTVWRVNDPNGPGGKRQRRFFHSRADAESYVRQRKETVRAFGIHFATFTPAQQADLAAQLHRLRRMGWPDLRAAVDHLERLGRPGPALPLETVAREYLLAKQGAGLRPRSIGRIRVHMDRFLAGRREVPISELTPANVRQFIACNGWAPRTARGHLSDLDSFFAWAIRQNYTRANPAAAVDKPRLDDKPPGILTVPQCAVLLHVCRVAEPTLLPTLALCLLAGVRPEEAHRLEWSNVGAEAVEIPGAKAKTRRRRPVPITPQLRAWLQVAQTEGGELPVANFPNKFGRLRRLAGLADCWPHDAMRHSFASYHLAKHRSEYQTALDMGTSPQMLFAHYRELVSSADAEAFFALLPAAKEEAAAVAAQMAASLGGAALVKLGRRSSHNRGSRQVTKAALGAVFAHGARKLPRAQARAALCDVHGLAPSTVDAALSLTGRFRAHLRQTADGLLEWEPFPLATPPGESHAPSTFPPAAAAGAESTPAASDARFSGTVTNERPAAVA